MRMFKYGKTKVKDCDLQVTMWRYVCVYVFM